MCRVWSGWLAILILVGGCEDVRLGWPESELPGARRPAQQPLRDARSESPDPATRPDAVAPQFYQLVLLSEPSPLDTAPGVRMVRLRHGAARRLGHMLAMLYLPAGPTGSANRFTLVYPSAAEWAAAGRAADIFEQALAGATSKPAGGVEFAAAAGAYDILASTGDRERAAAGVEQLRRVAQDRGQKRWFRWAAGLLAGRIMADVLQDPPAAAQLFHIAGAAAQPGSLEQMSAIFAEAQARLAAGESGPARRLLTRAVSEFDAFRDTEVFVRARRALAALPSKG